MKRGLGVIAVVTLLAAFQVSSAGATSPSPCPTASPTPSPAGTSAASDTRVASSPAASCPVPDPNQAAYDALRTRLGSDLANALTTEQRLSQALDQSAAAEQLLSDQISLEETRIADLEDKIAQLDTQITDTQDRIDAEKTQIATLARAIYRQPDSLWLLVARTGNLHDALVATADAVVAGQRAHALQARLEADLAKLQADRKARLADLDRENSVRDQLVSSLSAMDDLMSRQNDLSNQLSDLTSQLQDAQSALTDQPPDVTASLAQLIEQQEQDLIQKSYQAAWTQAQVGAGQALMTHVLPLGQHLHGFSLIWPMAKFQITQRFGPTDFVLEPPLGQYAHFHTGVDIAAPMGTPVTAAAYGVVVASAHTRVGYGNYVIIAHGGGIMTLYGHLLETDVNVGDKVLRGQLIGLEGSSGFSTGAHVHFELRMNDQVVDPMPYLPLLSTNWSG